MPFELDMKSAVPIYLVEAALGQPQTSEQVEAYARQQVELCNVERRKAGLPDFEFIKVEGDSILMRDPMPMRYVRGSHQIL